MTRTLVIGDVHGCSDELALMVSGTRPDRIVLVGDLYTKGPDPVGVHKQIREHAMEVVLGNHDQRLIDVMKGKRKDDSHGQAVVEALKEADASWVQWISDQPLFREVDGWTVVHAALHPSGKLDRTSRKTALSLRRWPDDASSDARWWEVYKGKRRVVFGHDARQGLLLARPDSQGRPKVVGLDTGCVYGGELTGMWLDDGTIVQVRAARAYKPVRGFKKGAAGRFATSDEPA
ncbi:MAG: metallophosphoesterase [Myxococcota bacterium]